MQPEPRREILPEGDSARGDVANRVELRDCAERLSEAVAPGIGEWIRHIAFLELAWLDTPSGDKRPPRVTKRSAPVRLG